MQSFSASPMYLLTSLVKNRRLMFDLARRDAVGRYKGSALGIFWSMLTPLLMLSVYTFVFSGVFKSRWGNQSTPGSHGEFAIVLFAGMLTFNIFSECVNRAPSIVLANTNFVKKIVFPLEILPCVTLLSALFHAFVSVTILLVAEFLIQGHIPATALLLPVVLVPLCLLILGISWLLSATGVYLRDIGQTIGIFVTALMFLSPIFFPASSLPANFQRFIYWNPLTFPIEQSRNVLIWGKPIDWSIWTIYLAIGLIASWIGFAWFQKTRKGFADVI
ncbi:MULTISPECIES: ABC transporter permease [Burkholderia]|nr:MULTISPECIES: ABC transporter permease [Burkholderia]AEO78344.1 ABC-2 transporter, inner membrane permease [Burkholderia pseudomallei]KGD35880.1 ABC-2 type transporter family protein [Burkholderia pseudomallei]KGS09748.1 ABC-2 type transporter family protein [Burkholderia pseudomallei MSHR5608]KGS72777.1 ABC-2 type transporter family protein [Burkholderia pseudomallei MSHR5596]KGU79231.1 ABC-2 type transporter family protein [Burkholderia pseudomallei MSHR543]